MAGASLLPRLEAAALESRRAHTAKVLLFLLFLGLDLLPFGRRQSVWDVNHLESLATASGAHRSERCGRWRERRGRISGQGNNSECRHRTHDNLLSEKVWVGERGPVWSYCCRTGYGMGVWVLCVVWAVLRKLEGGGVIKTSAGESIRQMTSFGTSAKSYLFLVFCTSFRVLLALSAAPAPETALHT